MDIDIKSNICRLKEDVKKRIQEIEQIENILFRDICLFAITEQYAQACGNIKDGNQKKFVNFLVKYSNEPILGKIDPVTLNYYLISGENLKNESLFYLNRYANPVVLASEIVNACETSDIISSTKDKNLKKLHRYCELIYKFRCKLSHELHSPSINWPDDQLRNEPFYSYIHHSSESEEIDGNWQLHFPYAFLKRVFIESIYAYLDACVEDNIRPFENYPQYLHWYES